MDKPHLSKFVFEAFDPVHEAGRQARWYGELAEFQKAADGVYRKVLSGPLTLAQLEARGFSAPFGGMTVQNAMQRAEAAEAQAAALKNEVIQSREDRDRAVTRAAEQALETGRQMNDANARIQQLEKQLESTRMDLSVALAARDNFAKLEKETRGKLIERNARVDEVKGYWIEAMNKLGKIPRWTRRIFGAI